MQTIFILMVGLALRLIVSAIHVRKSAITTVFRTMPRVGCVRLPDEGAMREVHYWLTRKHEGGVALLNDYSGTSADAYGGLNLVSVIAFVGEFRGAQTLRANFADSPCESLRGAN